MERNYFSCKFIFSSLKKFYWVFCNPIELFEFCTFINRNILRGWNHVLLIHYCIHYTQYINSALSRICLLTSIHPPDIATYLSTLVGNPYNISVSKKNPENHNLYFLNIYCISNPNHIHIYLKSIITVRQHVNNIISAFWSISCNCSTSTRS